MGEPRLKTASLYFTVYAVDIFSPHAHAHLAPNDGHAPRRALDRRGAGPLVSEREGTTHRLLRRLNPKGDYNSKIVTDEHGRSVHVVFERKEDADKFAEGVHATAMNRYPGWKKQRVFLMDETLRQAIRDALSTAR
jgi:hypothetical protein